MQFAAAQNINEVYDSVDPEAVLSILVHKVFFSLPPLSNNNMRERERERVFSQSHVSSCQPCACMYLR